MTEDKNPAWIMTNGNHRARGWENTEDGFWTPSLHDRRRVAVAALEMVAEKNGGTVYGPTIMQTIALNSTDPEDFKALADNFNRWMEANQPG